MTATLRSAGILLAALLTVPALAQTPAEQMKKLDDQRHKLQREDREAINEQLYKIRAKFVQDPDLAALKAAADKAQKALADKRKSDPDLAAADKVQKAAADALAKARAAAAAADPTLAALDKQVLDLNKQIEAADGDFERARRMLRDAQRKLADSQAMRDAAVVAQAAETAVHDLPKTLLSLADAGKALAEAEQLYDKARRELPEYRALQNAETAYEKARQAMPEYAKRSENPQAYAKALADLSARKAYEDAQATNEKARLDLPEYKVCDDAKKAYDKLMTTDPAVVAAVAARDAARKNLQTRLETLLIDDPDGAAALTAQKKSEDAAAEARKLREDVRTKQDKRARETAAANPAVVEARKAYDEAQAVFYKISTDKTAEDQKAYREASRALEQKLAEKLSADAEGAPLMAKLKAIDAKIQDLSDQVHKMRQAGAGGGDRAGGGGE
jgi:hypothetical protein